MKPTPLSGMRVLDISGDLAGLYCTKLLADAGADVTMVEPIGGHLLRSWAPHGAEAAAGGLFSYLCAGKSSLISEWPVHPELFASAEVVVATGNPSEASRVGVSWDRVHNASPAASLISVSPFGWTGPWAGRPATELTLQAWCGAIGFRGFPGQPPVSVGGSVGAYAAGAFAAVAALASRRSPPAHYDVSMLEAMVLSMQGYEWLHASLMGLTDLPRSVEVPSIEPAKDGWVGFSMVTGQQWLDFAAMVGQPQLADDPEMRSQLGRWPRRREVYQLVHPWLAERTVDEVVATASMYRLPVSPLGNGATVRGMDHFVERGVFVSNPDGFDQPRPPWLMSSCSPAPVRRVPQPGSAAGTQAEAAAGSGLGAGRPGPTAQPGANGRDAGRSGGRQPGPGRSDPNRLPLEGLRVLDFTAFWAGPSATFVLAALGADVIKIEAVQRPDGIRFAGGPMKDTEKWWEHSWIFHGANVNKRDLTLDLNSAEGRSLALRLAARADVAIENFSPRVMEAFGLGWEALSAANPALVMVRMPAFGLDGPWRDRVGFAPTMEQLSGMAWVTGHPDGPPMAPRGACDPIAGVHAAFATLAAIEHRDRTGAGTLVEVPMVEVALNVTAVQSITHQLSGAVLERHGNRGQGAPQNVYPCAGADAWVAIDVENDQQWAALASAMGDPSWARRAALGSAEGRKDNHDVLDQQVAAWTSKSAAADIVERLALAGVPAAPVVSPPDVVGNPQLLDRSFFSALRHPEAGEQMYAGLPFPSQTAAPPWCRTPPPLLGEHNQQVLGELGLAEDRIEDLHASRVVGDRPIGL